MGFYDNHKQLMDFRTLSRRNMALNILNSVITPTNTKAETYQTTFQNEVDLGLIRVPGIVELKSTLSKISQTPDNAEINKNYSGNLAASLLKINQYRDKVKASTGREWSVPTREECKATPVTETGYVRLTQGGARTQSTLDELEVGDVTTKTLNNSLGEEITKLHNLSILMEKLRIFANVCDVKPIEPTGQSIGGRG